jgi:A/G-specific adenine glycosylase
VSVAELDPAVRPAILAWFAERGRTLAFRRTREPYAILVLESMAQQTQIGRAVEYWERFTTRFPTVHALAAASPADVLREWAGLGYNTRALNLWRAARVIVDEHDGHVPSTIAALEALPGVGPYTARAVAAQAFGQPVGAIDVNVRRVLGRLVGGADGFDGLSSRETQAIADAAVPADDPGGWTHALMDLGATVCRAREPRCTECPVRAWCRFAAEGRPVGARERPRPMSAPTLPFEATNRWLRGRILDRLRAVHGAAWTILDAPIGDHDLVRVVAAAQAMARDGVVELDETDGTTIRARLPRA